MRIQQGGKGITAISYFLSIIEINGSCQQVGSGALLIVKNYVLGMLCGSQCFYVFDSHSKDENGNVSAAGTAVLLKFESLSLLESYMVSVYYSDSLLSNSFP